MSERAPVYQAFIDWYGHGGLTSGIAGWYYRPGDLDTFELSTAQYMRDGQSIKASASTSGDAQLAKMVTGVAGVNTTFSTWVYVVGGGDVSLNIWTTAGGAVTNASTALKNQWVELTVTLTQATEIRYVANLVHSGTVPPNHYYLGWSEARTTYDDVSCKVLATRQVPDAVYGRDAARDLSAVRTGEITLELENSDGSLTPNNLISPFAQHIASGRQVCIIGTFDSQAYVLYNGYIDTFTLDASMSAQSVTFGCVDLLVKMHETPVNTDLYESIRTGDAVRAILSDAGLYRTLETETFLTGLWSPLDLFVENGATTLAWWSGSGSAKDALDAVLAAEGAPSIYTVGSSNQIVFKDRHHRVRMGYQAVPVNSLLACSEIVLDATEFVMADTSTIDFGLASFYNQIQVSAKSRTPDPEITTVWTDPMATRVLNGRTVVAADVPGYIDGQAPIPGSRVVITNPGLEDETDVISGTTPEEFDFLVESGSVTVESYTASGTRVEIVFIAAGTATISGLQLRGRAIKEDESQVTFDDTGSQTRFRSVKTYELDTSTASANDTEDVALWQLKQNSSPRPFVAIHVKNLEERYTEMILKTDISESIQVNHPMWSVDRPFVVEGLEHIAGELGLDHELVLLMQQAEPDGYENVEIKFDEAGHGFDLGVFAKYSELPFVFGATDQGFGDGAFGLNANTDVPFILGHSTLNSSDEIWY